MVAISFCNHKGGTGKTTSVICVGAALGLSGYRVLIVDLDPQAFLSHMVGAHEVRPEASSEVLFGPDVESWREIRRRYRAFDLIPATPHQTRLLKRLTSPSDVFWVRDFVRSLDGYDVVLFDTAAAITAYVLNALVASQHVIIPIAPEYQPVLGGEQASRTVDTVRARLNPSQAPPLFLLTQFDARKRNHHMYASFIRERHVGQVCDTVIRTSASLAHAREDGESVFDVAPKSRGAIDYANLADELVSRLELSPSHRESQSELGESGTTIVQGHRQ